MGTIKLLWWPFGLLFRWCWWPFGLVLNPVIGRLVRWWQERQGEKGKRRREAQRHASALLSELGRLGFKKVTRTAKGKKTVRRIKYHYPLLMTHDELWLPLDQSKLPDGVNTNDLRDEDVIRSLEDRLNASVRPDYLSNGRLCYVVRLGGSAWPEKYSINKVEIPAEAPPLLVPFGIDHQGDQVLVDLLELKHLLVAGSTGGGKTTLSHAIISTIISRNRPDDVELRLVDMKRAEFGLYRPLLGKKGHEGIVGRIAVEPEDAIELLNNTLQEVDRRNKLMDSHGAVNLSDLAQSAGVRLKRIVLIVDEFPQLMLNKEKYGKSTIGAAAESLMVRIASLGRSSGITIIIATQMINKDVMTGMIKANFENRLCFSTADWRQSHMVVETSEADGLPVGRAIMRFEGKTRMVQTCLIAPSQVRLEVSRIAQFGPDGDWGGDTETRMLVKDAKLIISAACQHYNGELARSKMLALPELRGIISQDRFNDVAARLQADGIVEGGGPKKARRVVRAFFNKPHLLDLFYNLEPEEGQPYTATEPPTVGRGEAEQLEQTTPDEPAPGAGETTEGENGDTVYGSHMPPTPAPHEGVATAVEEKEEELPDLFFRAFAPREPEAPEKPEAPPAPKPKKPRKPRTKQTPKDDQTNSTEH